MNHVKITLARAYGLTVIGAAALIAPSIASAQTPSGVNNTSVQFQNPLSFGGTPVTSVDTLFNALLTIIAQVATVVAVLMFMYAGFLYVTARGDEKKIKDAHKIFKNTVIGTAILLSATLIYTILTATIKSVATGAGVSS